MESTLSLAKSELEVEVAIFAGFGPSGWDASQTEYIRRAVLTGLRSVYFTQEVVIGQAVVIPGGYNWSFLTPVAQITLTEGTNFVDMPDDFGGVLGRAIPVSPVGVGATFPVPYIGEGQMYGAEAMAPETTGRPVWALVEQSKGTSPVGGTRGRIRFYPLADQDYTLNVWYSLLPDAITDAHPYVYGGAQHAETFKAAVRAAYEQDFDGMQGNETAKFIERLKASISLDRRMRPVELGRNRDTSDDFYGEGYSGHFGNFTFNVNGDVPGVWSAY